MAGILIVGLIVGFVLGWGVYWYLQQKDSSAWTVPQFIRERPLAREISERVSRDRSAVDGQLLERTRTMLEHDAEVSQVKELDDEPAETAPVLTTPVASEENDPLEIDTDSDAAETTADEEEHTHDERNAVLAYCLTCQMRRQIQDAYRTETRTGRIAVRGVCPECGSELFTFVSTKSYD